MSDLEKKFIKCVRQEIATRKLTLTEVGEAIGSSRQVLSQILNGKFNSMRADTMLKLAMVLRISLDEIVFPETDLEAQIPKRSEWISVKDRLPEEKDEFGAGRYVLATDGNVTTRAFYGYPGGHDEWFINAGEQWEATFDAEVTHWMPLPDPPEEGER